MSLDRRALLAGFAAGALVALPSLVLAQGDAPSPAPVTDPAAFLKWSMGRHHALKSYQAAAEWSTRYVQKGQPAPPATMPTTRREIDYAAPNRFRIVTKMAGGFTQTSVSDGTKQVEYSSQKEMAAMTQDAPASLGAGNSMFLGHPMFCGSLLYLLFDGPEAFDRLVKTGKAGAPLRFGPDVTVAGEPCKTLKFFAATGTYGSVQMAVGTRDGIVRQIVYSSEPLLKLMQEQGGAGKDITLFETTERYGEIKTNGVIPATTFATAIPEGATTREVSAGPSVKPPVPLGQPAPGFTVASLAGKPASLESLRGKVVLIDFWATWCPPCRKGLPDTLRLHKELAGEGVAVLAVTDEDAKIVSPFLKKSGLTALPSYRDASGAMAKAYGVTAIPTVAVIDRKGNLSAFFVGLQERETLVAALKKAGLE